MPNITPDQLSKTDAARLLVSARNMSRESPNYKLLVNSESQIDYVLATYIAALEQRIFDLERRLDNLNYHGPSD
jgi:hypothetical protein